MPRQLYEYNGRSQTMAQWARECGLTVQTLNNRLANGWTIKKALTTPSKKIKPIVFRGKTYRSMQAFCNVHEYNMSSLNNYLKKGLTLEEAVSRYRAKVMYMGGVKCGHSDCFTCPYNDCIEPT